MSNYWAKRQKKLLNQSIDELNKLIASMYEEIQERLYAEMIDLYMNIVSEEKSFMNNLYKYNRYYKIVSKINKELTNLGAKEEKVMQEYLTKMYEDNAKIIQKQFPLSDEIDKERIQELCQTDWVGDGKNFSDRIWDDKEKLANILRRELVDAAATGKSVNQIAKVLVNAFDVEFYKAKRLAVTEMAHMQIQSTLDQYKKAGVKQIRVKATDDSKTCEDCRKHSNEVVDLEDAQIGVNVCPFHPQCRCYIVAVI